MRGSKSIILFVFVILNYQQIHSQKQTLQSDIDILISDSYEDLFQVFESSKKDVKAAKLYSKAFLLKAKKENDSLKKIEGYYLMARMYSRLQDYDKASMYLDSSITLAKHKKSFVFPAKSHILKANINGSQGRYQKAMDELAKANSYINTTNNSDQAYEVKYMLSLLQKNLGEFDKSIEILKEVISYYASKYTTDKTYETEYILALYAYSTSLNHIKETEVADSINKRITRLSLNTKDSIFYNRILLSSAVTHYFKKEYQQSLDSIKKSIKVNQNKITRIGTEVVINYYSGLNYYDVGKEELAITYLKKVDSIVFAKNYFPPGIRKNYERLIGFYKDKNDIKNQLLYINKLLYVDNELDDDVKYLSREINNEYTTPNLILEKQRIIDSLKKRKNITTLLVIFLLVFVIVFVIWNRKKQKIYKQRFKELIASTSLTKKNTATLTKSHNNEISEKIANDILSKLKHFEYQNGYLKMNLTITSVAKELNTNSKYLSKVINTHKKKKFTNYINDLRINYAVEQLKATDSKFRKYTVKAIANEVGFNTTEAFSKSFYKTTGIYPSFFMKQIEK